MFTKSGFFKSPARRHLPREGIISLGKTKRYTPIPDDPQIIKELSLEEFNSDLEGFRNMPGNENSFDGDDF